jgi:hypothetical protein
MDSETKYYIFSVLRIIISIVVGLSFILTGVFRLTGIDNIEWYLNLLCLIGFLIYIQMRISEHKLDK